jgi:hypothetical protein
VVDALRLLHDALVPDGKVIDTQPLSPRPAVFIAGKPVGSLDLREWVRTIAAVDAEIEQALGDGLFTLEAEERFLVTDFFDSAYECLDEVQEWAGTKVPEALEAKILAAEGAVTIEQEVRLRLLAKPA